jgi:tRNA-binding protein
METSEGAPKADVPFSAFGALDLRVATVVAAEMAEGTHAPCRQLVLDLGPLGRIVSVGQFALISPGELECS